MKAVRIVANGIISKWLAQRVLAGICFCMLLFVGVASYGQSSATGLPPYNSFDSVGLDNINLSNLNVNLVIPLYTRKGRGVNFGMSLVYNSASWHVEGINPLGLSSNPYWQAGPRRTGDVQLPVQAFWNTAVAHVSYPNWTDTSPLCYPQDGTYDPNVYNLSATYDIYDNFTLTDGAGTVHTFDMPALSNENPRCWNRPPAVTSSVGVANDGSGLTLEVDMDSSGNPTTTVTEKDGTRYKQVVPNLGAAFNLIIDRNGNEIPDSSYTVNSNYQLLTQTWTDTQGQTVLSAQYSYPAGGYTTTYTYPTATGAASFTVNQSAGHPVSTNFGCFLPLPLGYTGHGPFIAEAQSTGVVMIDSVVLANGQSYTFQYDQQLRITQITLPTGGTYTYAYPGPADCTLHGLGADTAIDRTVDGKKTSFRRTSLITGTSAIGTTAVTFPNNSVVTHDFDQSGLETKAIGNGTITYNCWDNFASPTFCSAPGSPSGALGCGANGCPHNRSTQIINTEDGSVRNTFEVLDGYRNTTETRDYDYGNTNFNAPDRRTVNTYLTTLLTESQVYDHGALASDTKYHYDGTTPTPVQPPVPQHDAATYGNSGNLTQVERWVGGSAWTSGSMTYFDTGNIASTTDANRNVTTYAYDACGGSFPTRVNHPGGLSESKTWECNSAQVASTTDFNGVVTNYSYADPAFSRITQRSRSADGATTVFSYNDSAMQRETRARITAAAGASPGPGWSDSIAVFDDLGRSSRKMQLNGQGQWETVDTSYDNMDNVSFVTVPYFSSGPSSTKQTSGTGDSYVYDGFNRLTQINHNFPGGVDTERRSYSGRDYATIDESGRQRLYRKDAFGRLQQVCEVTGIGTDPSCGLGLSGNGYTTMYSYDALGNLLRVDQKGSAASVLSH
jgi:YD repeat-containing protein